MAAPFFADTVFAVPPVRGRAEIRAVCADVSAMCPPTPEGGPGPLRAAHTDCAVSGCRASPRSPRYGARLPLHLVSVCAPPCSGGDLLLPDLLRSCLRL